ncbi:C6 transcription factor Prf [Pyronema omphalodes]|nr:C6 transcription factor Prf [Pyronema omphalodes]
MASLSQSQSQSQSPTISNINSNSNSLTQDQSTPSTSSISSSSSFSSVITKTKTKTTSTATSSSSTTSSTASTAAAHTTTTSTNSTSSSEVPKPKRIACVVCRKRKLRCNGIKPSCGTCSRLGHDCSYDEIRRKSGPKRGYVKALEARLAQVETLLLEKSSSSPERNLGRLPFPSSNSVDTYPSTNVVDPLLFNASTTDDALDPLSPGDFMGLQKEGNGNGIGTEGSGNGDGLFTTSQMNRMNRMNQQSMAWEMISLGIEEALPDPEIIEELHKIYFSHLHPCFPIIHRPRYFSTLFLAPHLRPAIALRYAIWTLASSISDRYSHLQTHFYHLTRKYLEETELKGHGENIISLSTAQSWLLICSYEFKKMYFPRAWMSSGRAVRSCQMMGLHKIDGFPGDVSQKLCLPGPKDEIEKEERRRVFWGAFCLDRYASLGTGWPMAVDERDVFTNLPGPEDAWEVGRKVRGLSLKEAMTPEGAGLVGPFAGVCLLANIFGRNLTHIHRPEDGDTEGKDDLNSGFWKRHRYLDNVLCNLQLSIPPALRLPQGIEDPNVVFMNMNMQTSIICLHQAALYRSEKHRLPASVTADSKCRCLSAAMAITSIMKTVCHQDLSGMNPFIAFCLYVAARVFVQYLKQYPNDPSAKSSLEFLLTLMHHLKKKNPLTESFLVQLDVDLNRPTAADPQQQTGCEPKVNKFPYTFRCGEEEIPPLKTNSNYPTPHPITEIPVEDLSIPRYVAIHSSRSRLHDQPTSAASSSQSLPLEQTTNATMSQGDSGTPDSQSTAASASSDGVNHLTPTSNGTSAEYEQPPPNYFADFAQGMHSQAGMMQGGIPGMAGLDAYGGLAMHKEVMMGWNMYDLGEDMGMSGMDMTDIFQRGA